MTNAIEISILTTYDIEAIISLLHTIYREAYILKRMYEPEAINSQRYIFVGAKVKNELVSMLTISFPTIVEIGTLCTSPRYQAYRNGEVTSKMISFSRKLVNNMANKSDICVLLICSVTKDVLTQKLQIWSNLIPVGITYCTRPEEYSLQRIISSKNFQAADFNDPALKRYDQIITVFCYPSKIQSLEFCLPTDLYQLVEMLFANSGIRISNNQHPASENFCEGQINIETQRSYASIQFMQGCNNPANVLNHVQQLIHQQYSVIHVLLNVGEYNASANYY